MLADTRVYQAVSREMLHGMLFCHIPAHRMADLIPDTQPYFRITTHRIRIIPPNVRNITPTSACGNSLHVIVYAPTVICLGKNTRGSNSGCKVIVCT